jgi:hypothetical protein
VAGDLIPPPSPAGRPPKDPVLEPRDEAAEAPGPEPAAAAERLPPSPFRGRFGFVLGALAGVALCAGALAVTLIATGSDSAPRLAENWSEWKPANEDTLAGAEAIAEHVGPRYLHDDGDQLVAVQGQPLVFQGLPVGVAVRPQGRPIEILDGEGLMYVLNGLGEQGMLPGKPSEARGSLLRREALELVLYTFRYLEDVTMVAVLLPPVKAAKQAGENGGDAEGETPSGEAQTGAAGETQADDLLQQALFFRPGDLLPQLQVPLDRTLAGAPPRPSTVSPAEAKRIDDLVLENLFVAKFERAQDGLIYLVLREPDLAD